jgi:hypothetical protein
MARRPKSQNTDALITENMLVGFTKAQVNGLELVAASIGMRSSQYVRQIAVERLVQLKVIANPMDKFYKPTVAAEA